MNRRPALGALSSIFYELDETGNRLLRDLDGKIDEHFYSQRIGSNRLLQVIDPSPSVNRTGMQRAWEGVVGHRSSPVETAVLWRFRPTPSP